MDDNVISRFAITPKDRADILELQREIIRVCNRVTVNPKVAVIATARTLAWMIAQEGGDNPNARTTLLSQMVTFLPRYVEAFVKERK